MRASFPYLPARLLWPLAASLVLSLLPWGKYALYPFKLFTTWVHECSHALMAVCLGGKVSQITLSPDTSGLTHYRIPKSRLRQALVTSAGYLGSTVAGCALYFLSMSRGMPDATWVELGLGASLWLSALIWVRGVFGLAVVLSLGAGMIALGRFGGHSPYTEAGLGFLAIQTGLNALLDIRTLWGLERGAASDARAMQSLFFLPAWFWALLWLSISLALTYWTVRAAA